jgi:hypothetical protein
VIAIRTESLWDDVDRLNMALVETLVMYGAVYNATLLHNRQETASRLTFNDLKNHTRSHGSEGYKVKSGLSKEGKEILCCHLSEDNQVFEDIVRRAVNMEDEEKERYLDQLYNDCGISKSEREKYNHQVVGTERGDEVKATHSFFSWAQWMNEKGCNVTMS